MPQESAPVGGTRVIDILLKLPLMLASLPLTMLPFLLPLYAKQLGATARGIGSPLCHSPWDDGPVPTAAGLPPQKALISDMTKDATGP